MTTEQNFNPGNVEPAKVNFTQDAINVQEEQLGDSTQGTIPDKPENHEGSQTPGTTPVQALPQDSEVYKNLQAAFTRTSQENSDLRGRLEQMEARLANMSTTQQPNVPVAPSHNFDEIDKTAGEFEELKPIAENIKRMQGEIDSQKTALDTQATNTVQSEKQRAQDEHEKVIMQVHPDAKNIMNSIDFQGWLQRQPSYMQGLLSYGSSNEIIDLFTAYKTASGSQNNQNELTPEQQALETARLAGAPTQKSPAPKLNTTDSNKRIYTNAEIGAMSFKEYAALAEDIDLALAEGRVTI